jgi:hypothetical protein
MGTTARIMLIAPCAGKASTSTTRTRKITSKDRLTQVKISSTDTIGGPIGSVNHFTASLARAWSPGIAVAVTSAAIREIFAVVVACVARCAPPL